jgi:hypothetical protein
MKKTLRFILLAAASMLFAACGGPAANTGANNANTNTMKPVAAAPTADALMALDKQANEAYVKGDSKFFEGMLSDKFVIFTDGGQRMDKARKRHSHFREAIFFLVMQGGINRPLLRSGRHRYQRSRDLLSEAR